jgi:hypothetical protein
VTNIYRYVYFSFRGWKFIENQQGLVECSVLRDKKTNNSYNNLFLPESHI